MHARYAELFSEHVAFSVNKTSVQDVVDMQAVLAYWDRVVQHQDELGGYDLLRTYPYRVNIDVQVSVGAFTPPHMCSARGVPTCWCRGTHPRSRSRWPLATVHWLPVQATYTLGTQPKGHRAPPMRRWTWPPSWKAATGGGTTSSGTRARSGPTVRGTTPCPLGSTAPQKSR